MLVNNLPQTWDMESTATIQSQIQCHEHYTAPYHNNTYYIMKWSPTTECEQQCLCAKIIQPCAHFA